MLETKELAGRRWIGWREGDELLACAVLSRDADGVVTVQELRGDTRLHGRHRLLTALIEMVNARAIVVDAAGEDGPIYEACGFTREESDGPADRWVRKLEAESDAAASPTVTLTELQAAIEAAWCSETSADPSGWTPANPAAQQCDVTALAVRDLLGGEIVIANVVRDGHRLERHAWNRLPSGIDVDLTRSQYLGGEGFGHASVAEPLGLRGLDDRYELFVRRVRQALGRPTAGSD